MCGQAYNHVSYSPKYEVLDRYTVSETSHKCNPSLPIVVFETKTISERRRFCLRKTLVSETLYLSEYRFLHGLASFIK